MNTFEWLNRFVFRDYFSKTEYFRNGYSFKCFEPENSKLLDGFSTDGLCGRIVYVDVNGQEYRTKSMIIKTMLATDFRTKYVELAFSNESFVYTVVVPFFAKLDPSIVNLFPKFYYQCLSLQNEDERGSIVLENLIESGYKLPKSKVFLDSTHLKLILKKLGEFHAYSYQAKKTHPEIFANIAANLIETHHTCTLETPSHYYDTLNEKYFQTLSIDVDPRYRNKLLEIREILKHPIEFFEDIFTSCEEPEAVICHGDFLRNNLLFRYNAEGIPVQVKFIDLANSRYCSPIVDLATILYMNTDQNTRDLYWDELIDEYYNSLKNTFPENDLVPSEDQIMEQFKRKSLLGYLSVSFFIPYMLEYESNPRTDWLTSLFSPEFEEYKELSWWVVPGEISARVILKMAKEERVAMVTDVLKDIIDRGFV
ncbi:uncharacterized protein LOC135839818 [Planococcus citri]|uniref:uncharacterized protein LOC135839818 n=1 Tax=Planococcus citri TaxID=170843 RepID=UPI0031F75A27